MHSKKVKLCAFGARYTHSNLALHCLASAVPFDVQIIEANINQNIDRVAEQIAQGSPDAVGFSCYIWSIDSVLKAASSVKKILPECLILLGGPQVSFDSEALMLRYSFIDMIVRGSGEVPFAHFMKRLNEGQSIVDTPSACVRDGSEIITTPDAPIFDMNELPFLYDDLSTFDNKIIYYETSRGCPYRCAYCMSADMPTGFLDVERVIKELEFFMQNNVRRVKLTDRTFNYPEARAYEILGALVSLSDKYPQCSTNFHFEISANLLTDEMLALFRTVRVGLVQFEVGIQSTNQQTLKAINRNFDMTSLMRNTRALCTMSNIHVHVDLIAGLPYEDYASFSRSFNDVYALGAQQIQLGFLKVLKGSPMFDMADKYEIAYTDYPPYEVLSTHVLSYVELRELHRIADLVDVLHNSGNFKQTITHMCKSNTTEFLDRLDGLSTDSQTCKVSSSASIKKCADITSATQPCNSDSISSSGKFAETASDVQTCESGAFAFFERFSGFALSHGYFERPQGKHVLFELLLEFAQGDELIGEALVYDWLKMEKPRSWPKGFKPNLPKKVALRRFYNSYNKLEHYENLTSGEKSSRSFVCTFSRLFGQEVTMLFDYSNQEKVTVHTITIR
ncbi:MAG: DUF4080 domain-containing protein [Clostridia bacterium]|jgi:radical SAM superfamily enzyme YgiQ (UPF0313 family)|nr:DUF4080 domain-containing protein [Clostridia bacterium]MBT7123073.1 DUF4080 domain-containing protein [Clostridia bacterium]